MMELVTGLDWFFYAITQLGEESFYIVALAFIYWSVNKKLGKKVAIVILTSLWINGFFKVLLKLPRPPESVRKIKVSGYGFPSGHAQGSTTLWGYLSLKIRKIWFYALSISLITLISYSRIYLQVHYVQDIVGGIILGLITIIAFEIIDTKNIINMSNITFVKKLLLPVIYVVILVGIPLILFPTEDIIGIIVISGALLGLTEGFIVEEEKIKLEDCKTNKFRVIRFITGMVIVFPIMIPLKMLLSTTIVSVFILYVFIGLLMSLIVPYIFKKLNI